MFNLTTGVGGGAVFHFHTKVGGLSSVPHPNPPIIYPNPPISGPFKVI